MSLVISLINIPSITELIVEENRVKGKERMEIIKMINFFVFL
jgi:hypothetical protein